MKTDTIPRITHKHCLGRLAGSKDWVWVTDKNFKFAFFQARSLVCALVLFIHIYPSLYIFSYISMSFYHFTSFLVKHELKIQKSMRSKCWEICDSSGKDISMLISRFQSAKLENPISVERNNYPKHLKRPKKDLIATLPQDANSWICYVGHKCRATLILYELHILKHLFVLKIISQD